MQAEIFRVEGKNKKLKWSSLINSSKYFSAFWCIECTMIYWIFTRSYSIENAEILRIRNVCDAKRCTDLHWNCPTHSGENKSNEVKRFNQTQNPKAPKPKPKPVEAGTEQNEAELGKGGGGGRFAKGWLTWAQQENHLTKYLHVDWKLFTLALHLPLHLPLPLALSLLLSFSLYLFLLS